MNYEVNVKERSMLVTYDERVTSPAKIVGILAEAGYSIAGPPQMM